MTRFIMVLGNGNVSIRHKRIDRAVKYFKSLHPYECIDNNGHILTYIMFCGKNTQSKQTINYTVSLGIDKKFLLEEKESSNTVENILFGKKIIDNHVTDTYNKIVICTSTFHIKRTYVITMSFMSKYPVEFIHTEENVNQDDYTRESMFLQNFLDYMICNQHLLS